MDYDKAFDSPVPGQSLTMTKGATRMEQPPQYVHVGEFAQYIFDKLTEKKPVAQIEAALKQDATITEIAFPILQEAVIKGVTTVDVALQSMNIVVWIIESIAKLRGIKYKIQEEDQELLELISTNADIFSQPRVADTVFEEEEPVVANPFANLG